MQSPLSFMRTASFVAPANPDWVEDKDFIPYAMDDRKETVTLQIDKFAKIRVEASWFNDLCPFDEEADFTLWGYRDGDCDYEGIAWVDRQEPNWQEEIKSE
ncbi:hypothetical protein ACHQM5_027727 [Ranunculus cassubicifolius]